MNGRADDVSDYVALMTALRRATDYLEQKQLNVAMSEIWRRMSRPQREAANRLVTEMNHARPLRVEEFFAGRRLDVGA